MSAQRARIVAPMLAALVLAATIGWYLVDRDRKTVAPPSLGAAATRPQEQASPPPQANVATAPDAPTAGAVSAGSPEPARTNADAGRSGPDRADSGAAGATPPGSPASEPAAPRLAEGSQDTKTVPGETVPPPVAPSFDVVRVEPTGESVIAGRAAPGATVDLMRDGRPLSRVVADATGLFALVPPALPPGTHEIVLQTIAPDGTRARSAQSVTVVIAAGGNQPPLVTVTAPDQPTVVLSRPDEPAPTAKSAAADPKPAPTDGAKTADAAPPPRAAPAPRPDIRIATVEAEGGRLFVSGQAAPGATVRLYLNDSLVAPGSTDSAGRMSFAIGRGIRPGDYRVRLDDVDPVTGAVRSRAEVPFSVPEPAVAAAPAPPAIVAAAPPQPAVAPPQQAAPLPSATPGAPAAGPPQSTLAGRQPPAAATAETNPAVPERQPGTSTRVASAPKSASDAAMPGFGAARTDPGQVVVPEINTAIVSRGDNLWRISKRVYGQGLRYTVIFGANSPQIRDPDLIYPGQVFVLPADTQGAQR